MTSFVHNLYEFGWKYPSKTQLEIENFTNFSDLPTKFVKILCLTGEKYATFNL